MLFMNGCRFLDQVISYKNLKKGPAHWRYTGFFAAVDSRGRKRQDIVSCNQPGRHR
jgi:hypothetical protein